MRNVFFLIGQSRKLGLATYLIDCDSPLHSNSQIDDIVDFTFFAPFGQRPICVENSFLPQKHILSNPFLSQQTGFERKSIWTTLGKPSISSTNANFALLKKIAVDRRYGHQQERVCEKNVNSLQETFKGLMALTFFEGRIYFVPSLVVAWPCHEARYSKFL